MPFRRITTSFILVWFVALFSNPVVLNAAPLDTENVFGKIKESIVQVKISNIHSGEKSSIGSGFYVSADGYLITNYHVISSVVREPENYRVELILNDGSSSPVTIVDIELIHDLALLKGKVNPQKWLHFHQGMIKKGTEIASIGNPHDLGMTAVKGSYSGVIEDSLYRRLHFTGAINPGMSGGPAVNSDSEVIGINVATAGNEIGFLVPAEYAQDLLVRGKARTKRFDATKTMQQQLLENQENFSHTILAQKLPLTELGDFVVPDKLAPFMKCWGDSMQDKEKPYKVTSKQCSTDNDIYIDRNYSTGKIILRHRYVESDQLSPYRFAKLYKIFFSDAPSVSGSKDDFTSFDCNTDFVQTGSLNMKLALCLRRHKKFEGLYDLLLQGATLERPTKGIQTSLVVTGISYANALAIAKRYIKAFRWKE